MTAQLISVFQFSPGTPSPLFMPPCLCFTSWPHCLSLLCSPQGGQDSGCMVWADHAAASQREGSPIQHPNPQGEEGARAVAVGKEGKERGKDHES